MLVAFLIFIVLASLSGWLVFIYYDLTKPVPQKGGEYVEGIIGQPVYVNPLLSQSNEADSDLVQLIYSGLLKYDKQGNLVGDLAERYEVSEDKKTYTVYLKKGIKWHDGEAFNASDVYFTLKILQDPAYKSLLRYNWQGVEIRQIDDYTLDFSLKDPYFGFLNNLTIKILPKHIWENVVPEKFSLVEFNLRPIGCGPYKLADLQKDSSGTVLSYGLKAFKDYFEGEPYISNITFNFYPDYDSMISAYNGKEIMGMNSIPPDKLQNIKNHVNIYELNIPHYFAVFFNQIKSVSLAHDEVRKALAYGVNRQEIIERVFQGKAEAVYSPFLPLTQEKSEDIKKYEFNPDEANKILEENGWKRAENGIREKDGTKLEIEISTLDWPELAQTADILSSQWEKIGVKTTVNIMAVSDLQQNHIRPREYESILFGQITSFDPDLYSFWHSSQKRDPGLNLSLFEDKNADSLLEAIRQESDEGERIKKYQEFQNILAEKIPAIFIYSNYYLYPVSQKVKGVDIKNINAPSWRFADISKWHIKTSRVRK